MIEYIKTDKLPFDPRPQMGRIFAEGFYQWLKYFTKDKGKLSRAMAHIFDLSRFYATVQGESIMAITACTDSKTPPISLDKKTLCSELGFIVGRITYVQLTKHLVNHKIPFELSPQTGYIEYVATAPEHRGKGAAFGLITHIMDVSGYTEYVLEVAGKNAPAIKLYEKLGYVEFKRVPAPKGSGEQHLVYMRKIL
jgi:ribosomal protein S18 acetylase RimI-like enzyme